MVYAVARRNGASFRNFIQHGASPRRPHSRHGRKNTAHANGPYGQTVGIGAKLGGRTDVNKSTRRDWVAARQAGDGCRTCWPTDCRTAEETSRIVHAAARRYGGSFKNFIQHGSRLRRPHSRHGRKNTTHASGPY